MVNSTGVLRLLGRARRGWTTHVCWLVNTLTNAWTAVEAAPAGYSPAFTAFLPGGHGQVVLHASVFPRGPVAGCSTTWPSLLVRAGVPATWGIPTALQSAPQGHAVAFLVYGVVWRSVANSAYATVLVRTHTPTTSPTAASYVRQL